MYPVTCPFLNGTYSPLCALSQMTGAPVFWGALYQPFHHGYEVRDDDVKEYKFERKYRNVEKGGTVPPVGMPLEGVPEEPSMGMPGHHTMPMNDEMKMEEGMMEQHMTEAQEILKMMETHHPDMIEKLTSSGMSLGEARQFISVIIQMTLMHHMMHS